MDIALVRLGNPTKSVKNIKRLFSFFPLGEAAIW